MGLSAVTQRQLARHDVAAIRRLSERLAQALVTRLLALGRVGGESCQQGVIDRGTGAVDLRVAEAWKPYDIKIVLESNWRELELKLAGKLNIFAGAEDNFYLEGAVRRLERTLRRLGSDAVVEIREGRNHTTVGDRAMLDRIDRELLALFDKYHGPRPTTPARTQPGRP